jgi:hypothetical protein
MELGIAIGLVSLAVVGARKWHDVTSRRICLKRLDALRSIS